MSQFLVYRIHIVSVKRWRDIPAVTMALTLAGAGWSLHVTGWLPPTQQYATDLKNKVSIVWAWSVIIHSN